MFIADIHPDADLGLDPKCRFRCRSMLEFKSKLISDFKSIYKSKFKILQSENEHGDNNVELGRHQHHAYISKLTSTAYLHLDPHPDSIPVPDPDPNPAPDPYQNCDSGIDQNLISEINTGFKE